MNSERLKIMRKNLKTTFAGFCVCTVAGALCLGASQFPFPKKPVRKPKLQSPRAMSLMANAAMAAPAYIPDVLTWEYDLPLPRDVTFVVLMAKTPNGPWTTFTETNQPPVRVNPVGFYKIETKNNL